MEGRIRSIMRWNAMAMVVHANRKTRRGGDLGGHIASFASRATLFDAGFNHFWHAPTENHRGDLRLHPGPRRRPASTPAPSSKAASPKSSCTTSARKSTAMASRPTRIPG